MQKGELTRGWNQQQAVRFGFLAGHLGEEFRPRDADRDGQSDPIAHVAAQPGRDVHGCPGNPPQPADVQERLVHRDRLDQR